MKKALVLFIGFICYQIICHAQVMDEHYYFKNLSVQNGLSQNTVNAILQDKQGFMWFGTKDGLIGMTVYHSGNLNTMAVVSKALVIVS